MTQPSRSQQKRRFFDPKYVGEERRRFSQWAAIGFGSVALFLFVQRFLLGVGIVSDTSMSPTLAEGMHFMIKKYTYLVSAPKRGDIVVFKLRSFDKEYLVKRVVGLEGETVRTTLGRIFINGKALKEPYVMGQTYPDKVSVKVPPGHCFVLGDNRLDSEDSRHFGPLSLDKIEGKLWG